jgi:hypothetical protein
MWISLPAIRTAQSADSTSASSSCTSLPRCRARITFFVLSFASGLKIENARAFLPYVLFGVLLAAVCVMAGRHLPKSGATIVGVVIGLLPGAILTIFEIVMRMGIELPLSIICLASASGIGGGVAASTSWRIQNT